MSRPIPPAQQSTLDPAASTAHAAATAAADASSGDTDANTDAAADGADSSDETVPGEEHLQEPGKKALAAMKRERNAAREAQRQAQAEIDALKAKLEGREQEHAAKAAEESIRAEALAKANRRVAAAELRAAAAAKGIDVKLAARLADLDAIEVDEDGGVDADDLAATLDALIAEYPVLAASGKTTTTKFDAAARNAPGTGQLSRAEFEALTPTEQLQAYRDGRAKDLLEGAQ